MPSRDATFDPANTAADVDQPVVLCPHCEGRIIVSGDRAWCSKSYGTGGCGAAWTALGFDNRWMWNRFGVRMGMPAHGFSPDKIARALPELRRRLAPK